jgi:N-acetylneuraminic acid mutarotase
VIGNRIYVFGGNRYPDGGNLKSTEVFDSTTAAWSRAADNEHNGGLGVEELTGAALNGRFYVFGAWGGSSNIKFAEEFDPASGAWTSKALMPTQRVGATAAAYDGKVYLFGGSNTAVVETFDPATNSWQAVTQMPRALAAPGIAVVGARAYVFGGADLASQQAVTDVSIYDLASNTWSSGGTLPVARYFGYAGAAPQVGGKVYLVGGGEGTLASARTSDRVDVFDTATSTWQVATALPAGVVHQVTVAVNGRLYVIGGNHAIDNLGTDIVAEVWSLALP